MMVGLSGSEAMRERDACVLKWGTEGVYVGGGRTKEEMEK